MRSTEKNGSDIFSEGRSVYERFKNITNCQYTTSSSVSYMFWISTYEGCATKPEELSWLGIEMKNGNKQRK